MGEVKERLIFQMTLTLSCPGKGRAVVKIGHSNLWPGSKELMCGGQLTWIL